MLGLALGWLDWVGLVRVMLLVGWVLDAFVYKTRFIKWTRYLRIVIMLKAWMKRVSYPRRELDSFSQCVTIISIHQHATKQLPQNSMIVSPTPQCFKQASSPLHPTHHITKTIDHCTITPPTHNSSDTETLTIHHSIIPNSNHSQT
jgi:hypothetical protein